MPGSPGAPNASNGLAARVAVGLGCVCVLLLVLKPGCTVTPDNYKALSFFFDGVPDPNASTESPTRQDVRPQVIVALSVHEPYLQEKCSDCHKSRLQMSRNDSWLCAKCHAGKEREHEYMHGPVAAQACLWCHDPHDSRQKHLLRDPDRTLCAQCHSKGILDTTRVPEHADENRACLECHVGHGGQRPHLLRAGAAQEGK